MTKLLQFPWKWSRPKRRTGYKVSGEIRGTTEVTMSDMTRATHNLFNKWRHKLPVGHYGTSYHDKRPTEKVGKYKHKNGIPSRRKERKKTVPMLSVSKIPYYVNQFLRRRVCFMRNQFKTAGRFSIKCVSFPPPLLDPLPCECRWGQNKTKKSAVGKEEIYRWREVISCHLGVL